MPALSIASTSSTPVLCITMKKQLVRCQYPLSRSTSSLKARIQTNREFDVVQADLDVDDFCRSQCGYLDLTEEAKNMMSGVRTF